MLQNEHLGALPEPIRLRRKQLAGDCSKGLERSSPWYQEGYVVCGQTVFEVKAAHGMVSFNSTARQGRVGAYLMKCLPTRELFLSAIARPLPSRMARFLTMETNIHIRTRKAGVVGISAFVDSVSYRSSP